MVQELGGAAPPGEQGRGVAKPQVVVDESVHRDGAVEALRLRRAVDVGRQAPRAELQRGQAGQAAEGGNIRHAGAEVKVRRPRPWGQSEGALAVSRHHVGLHPEGVDPKEAAVEAARHPCAAEAQVADANGIGREARRRLEAVRAKAPALYPPGRCVKAGLCGVEPGKGAQVHRPGGRTERVGRGLGEAVEVTAELEGPAGQAELSVRRHAALLRRHGEATVRGRLIQGGRAERQFRVQVELGEPCAPGIQGEGPREGRVQGRQPGEGTYVDVFEVPAPNLVGGHIVERAGPKRKLDGSCGGIQPQGGAEGAVLQRRIQGGRRDGLPVHAGRVEGEPHV